jgi:hypothetical protein
LLDDVEHADRGHDRGLGIVIEPAQHRSLAKQRDQPDDKRRQHQRQQETRRRTAGHQGREEPGEHGAQHEEFAVGDVDHTHDAEHQRQAERGQRQHGCGDQAFQRGQKKMRAKGHCEAVSAPAAVAARFRDEAECGGSGRGLSEPFPLGATAGLRQIPSPRLRKNGATGAARQSDCLV